MADYQQGMIASFLEIAVGQSDDIARQFLQATGWNLDEAIQLFYVINEGSTLDRHSNIPNSTDGSGSTTYDDDNTRMPDSKPLNTGKIGGDDVRPPLPVKRDLLYDDTLFYGLPRMSNQPSSDVAFRNFDEEMKNSTVWESEQGSTSAAENPRDNLASLYRPPFHMMFRGSFEKAKGVASQENKWLIVNVQSNHEFSSHMLNRDTWANEAVSQTISSNFVFWQVSDDTTEGGKVCTFYKLDSFPVVLVIDPITGQKMRSWCGMVQPESLLDDLTAFMEHGPRNHRVASSWKHSSGKSHITKNSIYDATSTAENMDEDAELQAALAASMEYMKASAEDNESVPNKAEEACSALEPAYPPLPDEPKEDRSLLCRVGVRLPDGRGFREISSGRILYSYSGHSAILSWERRRKDCSDSRKPFQEPPGAWITIQKSPLARQGSLTP